MLGIIYVRGFLLVAVHGMLDSLFLIRRLLLYKNLFIFFVQLLCMCQGLSPRTDCNGSRSVLSYITATLIVLKLTAFSIRGLIQNSV